MAPCAFSAQAAQRVIGQKGPLMLEKKIEADVAGERQSDWGARDRGSDLFLLYMVLVGIVVGAILVAAPQVQDFAIKPYFSVLIAVGLFDGGNYLLDARLPGEC